MASIDTVKRCSLFFELLDEEIDTVIQHCFVQSFEPNQLIIRENEIGSDFLIILSGKAKVTKNINGREIEIAIVKKGDALGEAVLINEGKRTTNVIALGQVDALIINQSIIYNVFEKNPKIFAILMLNLARMLSGRLRNSNRAIAKMHERFKLRA